MTDLNDVKGMLKRVLYDINEHYAQSDLRYDVEHTQKNLYSINEIDITDKTSTAPRIIKTLVSGNLDQIYWYLYVMANTIENLNYEVDRMNTMIRFLEIELKNIKFDPYKEKQIKTAIRSVLNIQGIKNLKSFHKGE